MKLDLLEDIVYNIITNNEKSRSDDMTLYLEYLKYKSVSLLRTFQSREYRIYNGISSFESVSRCRRRIQAYNPELKPNKEYIELRKEEEKRFREYAKSEKLNSDWYTIKIVYII